MENSKISWCDHTFNPWIGCTKVSPGCLHCYAESLNQRWRKGENWGKGAPRSRTSEKYWKEPLNWNRNRGIYEALCLANVTSPGPRPRVFCASLADWLDDEVQIEWLADLLRLITNTPNLDWLLLSKRPENFSQRLKDAQDWHFDYGDRDVAGRIQDWWKHNLAWPNVWVGTSVEDQTRAELRVPLLMKIPAKVRFLSCEPLLGPVNLIGGSYGPNWLEGWDVEARQISEDEVEPVQVETPKINWVIVGGESGAGAREMNTAWADNLRIDCLTTGCAFFMKQMGGERDKRHELDDLPESLRIRHFPA